jgi:hypothetical protein
MIDGIIERANKYEASSLRWARIDHYLHFILGISAAVAGALAGYAGATEATKVSGLAGAAAALLAVLQTFVKAEQRSQFHFSQVAQYEAAGLRGEVLRERGNPTKEELDELIDLLRRIRGRPFGNGDGSPT